MSAPPARSGAPRLIVVHAAAGLSERTVEAVDAGRDRGDHVVVAVPAGAPEPTVALRRRLRAELTAEAAVPELAAAHGAAGGVVVVVDGQAHGPDRSWLRGLADLALAGDALAHGAGAGTAVLACTNAAPWPVCPPDLPDARASRADWRTFARSLAGRPVAAVTVPAERTGPALALSPAAVAALWGDGAPTPAGLRAGDLADALAAAGGRVVRADAVYVHDPAAEVLLSACLIMKDEEDNLVRCLDSLRGVVDEVVVYDTGSTDGSVALARSLGAVVVPGAWHDDFALARNASRAHCRGRWLLHVDADEVIENPAAAAGLRRALAGELQADLLALPLHNMHGTELAPVRDANPHWVPRVLHRTRCRWTGALHEHPMPVRGGLPRTVRAEAPSLVHYGYLDEVVARRGKLERNERIAATKLDEQGEAGRTHFDRGRTAMMTRDVDRAVAEFALAADAATNPVHRRCAMELAATALLDHRRAAEALVWIERRAAVPDRPGVARWLRARHAVAEGRPDDALALLDGLADCADNFSTTGPDAVHHLRAQALVGLGRDGDAGAELVAAIAGNPTYDRAWKALVRGADRWPDAITAAARHLERDQLKLLAARVLQAPDPLAGIAAEALWTAHPGAPALVAAAIGLAPRLELEDAARWATRIRATGLVNRCPLRHIAADVAAPVTRRLQAAYLGAELFADAELAAVVRELSTPLTAG